MDYCRIGICLKQFIDAHHMGRGLEEPSYSPHSTGLEQLQHPAVMRVRGPHVLVVEPVLVTVHIELYKELLAQEFHVEQGDVALGRGVPFKNLRNGEALLEGVPDVGPQAVAAGQRCLECGCMAFNDCRLRDFATDAGALQAAYAGDTPRKLRDERHPFIVRKVGKCVSCGRCIRVCADVCGVSAIDFVGRGIETEVQAPFNRAWQDSACVACGACVDACPTGALYDRTVLGKQVPLDLTRTDTVCSLCGLGCRVASLTLDGEYMGTVPSSGEDVLCVRGRYGWHATRDVARITSPMIRYGSALMAVSWDEALAEATKRLVAARRSAVVFGTGLLTCEEGWLTSRLAESLQAGPPIFDVHAAKSRMGVRPEDIVGLNALGEPGRLIVAVGPREPHEKTALDVILRRAIRSGSGARRGRRPSPC